MKVNLGRFKNIAAEAEQTVLTGDAEAENTFDYPEKIVPVTTAVKVKKVFEYVVPPMSLTVIRIKTK